MTEKMEVGKAKDSKMSFIKSKITEMWRNYKLRKNDKKEKGHTVEVPAVQENQGHSMGCTNSLQSEQHCTDALLSSTSSTNAIKSSQHDRPRADSLNLQFLHTSSIIDCLKMTPSLSLTSLIEDDFEPPTPFVSYERQMSSSVASMPYLDDNSFVQNMECKQTSDHSTSLDLISRNRCLSSSFISYKYSTVGHSSYQSVCPSQPDTLDLFQFLPTTSIEALDLAQLSGFSHQYKRPGENAVDESLCLSTAGNEMFTSDRNSENLKETIESLISDRTSENLIETVVTETVEESLECEKPHVGSHKSVLNLENEDFIERPNQFNILQSAETRTCMEQQHKNLKHQANKLATVGSNHGLRGKRRQQVHVFHKKDRGRKGIPIKKVHHAFQHKNRDRKGTHGNNVFVFHQKGRNRKWEKGRAHHVFHQKGWYQTRNMKRKVLLQHKGLVDRRDRLRKRAHVFHQKSWGGREIPRKRRFHLKAFDGKDGLNVWAEEQLLCSTTLLDKKCLRTNSENKKRKKQPYGSRKLVWKNLWETWQAREVYTHCMFGKENPVHKQAMNLPQHNLRKLPRNLDTEQRYKVEGQRIQQPMSFIERRPGGRPSSPKPPRVLPPKKQPETQQSSQLQQGGHGHSAQYRPLGTTQPENQQSSQLQQGGHGHSAQYRPLGTTQPENQQSSQLQQGGHGHSAQYRPLGTTQPETQQTPQLQQGGQGQDAKQQPEQNSEPTCQHTTTFGAVHNDMSQTEQAAGELEPYNADFQKKLPSARGRVVCKRRTLWLKYACQIDCILLTIFLLAHFHPQIEQMFRNNADDGFQWLYFVLRKCRVKKFDYAKLLFWLKHGFSLPAEDFLDFRVNLEADWILEPLKIKISQQMSKCKTCNESCMFGEKDQDTYFQNSFKSFAERCHKHGKHLKNFQDCIDAWSFEKLPCSRCENGYCLVTRRLDCVQSSPPLLPIPTFFEKLDSSGHLQCEFPLPVPLDGHTLDQPQELSIGKCHYRLHALSYAITKQTRTEESYLHERCQVWNDSLSLWQYYDGEGWNEDCRDYKLKTGADNTPGKSYRVAYFRLVGDEH